MSDVNTLKEFLISLGFKVDASSERAFTVSVDNVEKAVNDLGEAAKQSAADSESSANKSAQANSKAAQESNKSAKSQSKDKSDISRAESQAEEARKKAEKVRQDANKRYREDLEKSHKDQLEKNKAQIAGFIAYSKAIQAMAIGAAIGIVKITNDLNELYFASLRTGATVDTLQSLEYLGKKTGSNFLGATEGLAEFIRSSPGAEDVLHRIGVATRKANGDMRDMGDQSLDVANSLAKMPIAVGLAYAKMMGMDTNTLLAARRGDLQKEIARYDRFTKIIGIDSDKAAKDASAFKGQMTDVATIFDLIGKKVAGNIANDQKGGLNKLIDYLLSHTDQIVTGITNFANAMASLAISIAKVVGFLADVVAFLAPLTNGVTGVTSAFGDWSGALNLLLVYVGGKWLLGMLASVGKVSAAIGVATAQSTGLMVMLGKAGMIGGAGAAGYGIGSLIYKYLIDGTKFGESIGKGVANVLGFFGVDEARQATQARSTVPTTAPTKQSGVARGIRNNNPGNIEYGDFARRMGATSSDGRFAIFPTAESGLSALSALLTSYGNRGINTTQAIINRFAPPTENNTAGYSAGVAKALGVSQMQPLNIAKDPIARAALMQQITRIENGSNPYSSEMMINASRTTNSNSNSRAVSFSQQTNIHVNSGGSAIAQDVANASSRATESAIRNFIPKVQ